MEKIAFIGHTQVKKQKPRVKWSGLVYTHVGDGEGGGSWGCDAMVALPCSTAECMRVNIALLLDDT